MSNADNFLTWMRHQQDEEAQKCRQQAEHFLPLLREMGITRVEMDYDGSGDSGSVDRPRAWDGSGERLGAERPLPDDLSDSLMDWLSWFLPGGWEINDGSFGKAVLNITEGTFEIQHSDREMITHDRAIEGRLDEDFAAGYD